jgi:flagellar biosynthesis/type III secretory pathway protein FliH
MPRYIDADLPCVSDDRPSRAELAAERDSERYDEGHSDGHAIGHDEGYNAGLNDARNLVIHECDRAIADEMATMRIGQATALKRIKQALIEVINDAINDAEVGHE